MTDLRKQRVQVLDSHGCVLLAGRPVADPPSLFSAEGSHAIRGPCALFTRQMVPWVPEIHST